MPSPGFFRRLLEPDSVFVALLIAFLLMTVATKLYELYRLCLSVFEDD